MRGTASLVVGMMADTMFMNTVNDNRIVTSAIRKYALLKISSVDKIFLKTLDLLHHKLEKEKKL